MGGQVGSGRIGRVGRPARFARADAIEAAMNLFWKRGYPAVSATDLADAMSIQRSSFYNSFGSREAVFEQALARYAAQAPDAPLDDLQAGAPSVPVLVDVLRGVCRVRAADREARGCLVCNSIAELVGTDVPAGALLEAAVKRRQSSLKRLLRQAVRQNELPALEDESAVARAIVAFMIGLNTISKVVRREDELWAMCRRFLIGLGVPPGVLADSRPPKRAVSTGRTR